jgi:hypothetical protein
MVKYRAERKRLARGHGWRAQPNHNILVLGRGTVQLEYPRDWILDADDDCVKVRDRKEPDDECVLGVSYHCWPAVGAGLSVATLVRDTLREVVFPMAAP